MSPWSRQYMSAVFYHNEEQKSLALETKAREEARSDHKLFTEIAPFSRFYIAEDYHQKYRLQQESDLIDDFKRMYPATEDFIDSTAAARVNGYADGYGTSEALDRDLNSFGLSPAGKEKLLEIAGRGLSASCAVP